MVRAYLHICAAKKCYNSRLSHPTKSFFGFPSDTALCKTWLENCGRTDLSVTSVCKSNGYYKLCADHFEPKWFTDSTKTLLIRHLNPVPSIFINNIGKLLPPSLQSNCTADIDLPSESSQDAEDAVNCCESFLNPTALLVGRESLPISYRSYHISKKGNYDPETISRALVNLNPQTQLNQLDEMCRLCMNKVPDNHVDIFSESEEANEIKEAYEIVMPKKMKFCDGLPHKVCEQCIHDLKTCRKMIEQFKNAYLYIKAIAKYSLFIENEDDSRVSDSEEDSSDVNTEEFVKPIPKSALVMPFKNFESVLESPEYFIEDTSNKEDTNNREDISTKEDISAKTSLTLDKESFPDTETAVSIESVVADNQLNDSYVTPDSVAQILQSLNLPTPQINLITNEQKLWQDSVKLICSNVVILPTEECMSQKSFIGEKPANDVSNELQDISFFNLKDLGKEGLEDLELFSSSKNAGQQENEKNFENLKMQPISEHSEFDSMKAINHNIFEMNNKSDGTTSYLTVSFKCLECTEIFPSYSSLVEHVLTSHQILDSPTSYSCTICSKEFTNSTLLKEHLKMGHEFLKVSCPKCDEKFKSRKELNDHVRKTHYYTCILCDSLFNSEEKLKQHVEIKHDDSTECRFCGKRLKTVQTRKLHEVTHNKYGEVCWVCGLTLKTKFSLRTHLKLHDGKSYNCGMCERVFNTPQAAAKHRRLHKPENRVKKFLCEYCPKTFLYKQALTKHMTTHTKVKPFHCKYCSKGFLDKRHLLKHEEHRIINLGVCYKSRLKVRGPLDVKEDPSFECDVCGRKFIKNTSLERHKKFHFSKGNPEIIQKLLDEPEVQQCNDCSRIFFSKHALQYHMRLHTGSSKPFKCDFCGKSYASNHQKRIHERSHTGEKPFQCHYCKASFGNKVKLNEHVMEHTGTIHMCQVCDKTFKTRKRLLIHSTTHKVSNSLRPFGCSQCVRTFTTNNYLRLHFKSAHSTAHQPVPQPQQIGSSVIVSCCTCSECGKMFLTHETLKRHIKKVHESEEYNEVVFKEEELVNQDPQPAPEYLNMIEHDQSMNDFGLQELSYIMHMSPE